MNYMILTHICMNNYISQRFLTKQNELPIQPLVLITAGQRGYSLLTGFLGSNKTVNRCANCGHTWKP